MTIYSSAQLTVGMMIDANAATTLLQKIPEKIWLSLKRETGNGGMGMGNREHGTGNL